jgi:hypothetical protein
MMNRGPFTACRASIPKSIASSTISITVLMIVLPASFITTSAPASDVEQNELFARHNLVRATDACRVEATARY